MRILHYSRSLSRSAGGLFYSVSGLAKALLDLGIDVSVIGGADEDFPSDRGEWGAVPLFPHPLKSGGYGLSNGPLAEIGRQKPDLIHLHGIWSASSIYGRIAAARGIPAVVSPRGMLDPWILARRPHVKRVHAALFENPLFRRGNIHALCGAERDAVLSHMPSLQDRIFVVSNGVRADAQPDTSASRSGALYLGRLHSKKQVVELIRAWQALPEHAETLTIAGWGDANYELEVRSLVDAVPNVHFAGSLYGPSKDEALRKARFFVLPSLSEGLPMAVLEALQAGCIPVITDQCNLPELIGDRIALRMETDFSDFGRVMGQAFAMPEQRARQWSMAASEYAKRYHWTHIASEMVKHYERILGLPGGEPQS